MSGHSIVTCSKDVLIIISGFIKRHVTLKESTAQLAYYESHPAIR